MGIDYSIPLRRCGGLTDGPNRHTINRDMATLRKKNFANPDIERDVGRGLLRIIELGDVAIGWIEYQPGWSWKEDLKERVGTGRARSATWVSHCPAGSGSRWTTVQPL